MEGQLSISRGRRFALAFVAATVIGAIGPWVDLGGATQSGLDVDDGVVTLVIAGIAFAYLIFGRGHWIPTATLGALIAAVGILDIADVESVGGLVSFASPGWGLYLTAIAGIGMFLSAAVVMRSQDETDFDLFGKFIVVLAAIVIVLAVIGSLTEEEVKDVTFPEEPLELPSE
jgi:hypothetical protein